jgi:hypothetical protein
VHHKHVLRLERLLLPAALLPLAHEQLLVGVDVVVGDVLQIGAKLKFEPVLTLPLVMSSAGLT